MGLLDSLFNQSTYGGQGGGLLDLLRQSQMQQEQYQPSMGFGQSSPLDTAQWPQGPVGAPSSAAGPIAVGNYQMPRTGNMAQFTPPPTDPAALPVNAQPAQGQLPQQSAQPGGFSGFLNSLNENFQNMGNGGSLIGALTGQAPNNQTAQYLVRSGIDPALAKTIVGDPTLLRAVLPSLLGTGGKTNDIKEYEYARKEDPTLSFKDFLLRKKATSGEYSLNPFYAKDKDGKTVAYQLGKDGKPIKVELPEGTEAAAGTEKIDAGTHFNIYDKRSGQIIGTMPKNIEGKEAAEERGKALGQAQVNLPNVLAKSQQSLDLIDEMIKHPGRGTATGVSSVLDPRNYLPGTDAKNFQVRSKQLEGKTFLEAFESLKGAGAITEVEGAKATQAIARLDRSQSDEEYLVALNDLKKILAAGMERARARAGQAGQSAQTGAPPAVNLKAKYGLD